MATDVGEGLVLVGVNDDIWLLIPVPISPFVNDCDTYDTLTLLADASHHPRRFQAMSGTTRREHGSFINGGNFCAVVQTNCCAVDVNGNFRTVSRVYGGSRACRMARTLASRRAILFLTSLPVCRRKQRVTEANRHN